MSTDLQQTFELGRQEHCAGRLAEAEAIYRQVLAQQPEHSGSLHLLGVIAHQLGQNQSAVELIQRAIASNRTVAEYYSNLGLAFAALNQTEQAVAAYQAALQLKYNYPQAHYNLGLVLEERGQRDDAIAAYQTALQFNPNFAKAYYNLGNALQKNGALDAAIACYQAAIQVMPGYAEAYHNLGVACLEKDDFDAALRVFQEALARKPAYAEAYNSLGNVRLRQGLLDEAIKAYLTAHQLAPDFSLPHSNRIFTVHYHTAYSAKMICEEHRRWNLEHAAPLKGSIQPHTNDRNPNRRLKIGYVSPDFRDHPVGRHIFPVVQRHDRQQFEVVCYSNVADPDAMTAKFGMSADQWREIGGIQDQTVADMMRADGIDILVDLALHTAGTRLFVFARKPAPIQVTFAGYPSTTGLETMDFRFSDPWLDPPNRDAFYTEETIRLPDSFWLYDVSGQETEINQLPAIETGTITFGCFNNFCKITDRMFQLWAEVLGQVKNSRLLILTNPGSHRERAVEILKAGNIAPNRLEFVPKMSRNDYLRLYHRLDIVLDTFPYGGHTTTCDALWMGAPVVTLAGETAVSRGGLSLLTNLGLPELVADSEEAYVRIASNLASDLGRLEQLRGILRQKMAHSPLVDCARFTKNIESAYREMWRRWCGA